MELCLLFKLFIDDFESCGLVIIILVSFLKLTLDIKQAVDVIVYTLLARVICLN